MIVGITLGIYVEHFSITCGITSGVVSGYFLVTFGITLGLMWATYKGRGVAIAGPMGPMGGWILSNK